MMTVPILHQVMSGCLRLGRDFWSHDDATPTLLLTFHKLKHGVTNEDAAIINTMIRQSLATVQ